MKSEKKMKKTASAVFFQLVDTFIDKLTSGCRKRRRTKAAFNNEIRRNNRRISTFLLRFSLN
ncbi:MAG: hypothetical protein IJA52_03775 [Clostridia bacterium]|nr:hypothetical protein [Clostridia bacterium]